MNWQAVGAISEAVGAVGVIATLVYLAYQIRQNTEQLEQSILSARVSAVNASQVTLRENRQSIFEDAEMAEIFLRGNRSPESLTEVEALRYRLLMQNVTEAMLEIFSQTATTNFSPETWETQGRTLVLRVMGTPGGNWFWEKYSDNYPEEFRRAIDELIASPST